jgi:hypothetical protein
MQQAQQARQQKKVAAAAAPPAAPAAPAAPPPAAVDGQTGLPSHLISLLQQQSLQPPP